MKKMKKVLFILTAVTTMSFAACSGETVMENEHLERGIELPDQDANLNAEPDTVADSSTIDTGFDSTDVVPDENVVKGPDKIK